MKTPGLVDNIVRQCFFVVRIDGHQLASSRASIDETFGKPTVVSIMSMVREENGVVKYTLAPFFDGKPHDVEVDVLDRDRKSLGSWCFKAAKPVARSPGRWDNANAEPLTERVVFECEVGKLVTS